MACNIVDSNLGRRRYFYRIAELSPEKWRKISRDTIIYVTFLSVLFYNTSDAYCSRIQSIVFPILLIYLGTVAVRHHYWSMPVDWSRIAKYSLWYILLETIILFCCQIENNIRFFVLKLTAVFGLYLFTIYLKKNCETDNARRTSKGSLELETEIYRLLEVVEVRQQMITRQFEAWIPKRRVTIDKLEEMIQKLDRISFYCKWAQIAAESVVLVGSALKVVGAFFNSSWGETANSSGQVLKTTGLIAGPAAAMSEDIFSQSYLNEFDNILKADQEFSVSIKDFLRYSRTLDGNLQRLFGIGLRSEIWDDVVDIYHECAELFETGCTEIFRFREIWAGYQGRWIDVPRHEIDLAKQSFLKFVRILTDFRRQTGYKVCNLVYNVFKKLKDSANVAGFIKWSRRLGCEVIANPKLLKNVAILTSEATRSGGTLPLAGFCGIEALSVVMSGNELLNIRSSPNVSKYSEGLKAILQQLEQELRVVEEQFLRNDVQ